MIDRLPVMVCGLAGAAAAAGAAVWAMTTAGREKRPATAAVIKVLRIVVLLGRIKNIYSFFYAETVPVTIFPIFHNVANIMRRNIDSSAPNRALNRPATHYGGAALPPTPVRNLAVLDFISSPQSPQRHAESQNAR
jgi:hypothetical protein